MEIKREIKAIKQKTIMRTSLIILMIGFLSCEQNQIRNIFDLKNLPNGIVIDKVASNNINIIIIKNKSVFIEKEVPYYVYDMIQKGDTLKYNE